MEKKKAETETKKPTKTKKNWLQFRPTNFITIIIFYYYLL